MLCVSRHALPHCCQRWCHSIPATRFLSSTIVPAVVILLQAQNNSNSFHHVIDSPELHFFLLCMKFQQSSQVEWMYGCSDECWIFICSIPVPRSPHRGVWYAWVRGLCQRYPWAYFAVLWHVVGCFLWVPSYIWVGAEGNASRWWWMLTMSHILITL